MKFGQPGKSSPKAIALKIAEKFPVDKNEIIEILFNHHVHKAYMFYSLFYKLKEKFHNKRCQAENEVNLIKEKMKKLNQFLPDKDNKIIACSQELEWWRGYLAAYREFELETERAKSRESQIVKNFDKYKNM